MKYQTQSRRGVPKYSKYRLSLSPSAGGMILIFNSAGDESFGPGDKFVAQTLVPSANPHWKANFHKSILLSVTLSTDSIERRRHWLLTFEGEPLAITTSCFRRAHHTLALLHLYGT